MKLLLLIASLLCSSASAADDPEVRRLTSSMDKLAQKNAWDGVERAYNSIVELGGTEDRDAVLLAAEAARNRGDVAARIERLEVALKLGDDPDTAALIQTTKAEFGQVVLSCKGPCPTLIPEVEPFRPDLKNAITRANTTISEAARFGGYVPTGDYIFGFRKFNVPGGDAVVSVESTTKAAKLEGLFEEIALPPQVTIEKKFDLMLNGAGIYEEEDEIILVAALYTKGPMARGQDVIAANEPKRIVLHYLKPYSNTELYHFYEQQFASVDPSNPVWGDTQNFQMIQGDVDVGGRVTLDWTHKKKKVIVDFPNQDPETVGDEAFMQVLYGLFLGDDSLSAEMTQGMLGQQ